MRFTLSLLLLVLPGCGAAASPSYVLSPGAQARLEAETSVNDLPVGHAKSRDFAVRVYRNGPNPGRCSGALIGTTRVVTALHCVMAATASGELTSRVMTPGELHVELGGGALPWGRVGVIGVRTCGPWQAQAAGDVAVLELSQAVPSDVPLLTLGTASKPGDGYVSLGFGTEADGWRASAVPRHVRTHTAQLVTDGIVLLDGEVAHGDSGGPIINRETGELVAVASMGSAGHTGPGQAGQGESTFVVGARVDRCADALGLQVPRD